MKKGEEHLKGRVGMIQDRTSIPTPDESFSNLLIFAYIQKRYYHHEDTILRNGRTLFIHLSLFLESLPAQPSQVNCHKSP